MFINLILALHSVTHPSRVGHISIPWTYRYSHFTPMLLHVELLLELVNLLDLAILSLGLLLAALLRLLSFHANSMRLTERVSSVLFRVCLHI